MRNFLAVGLAWPDLSEMRRPRRIQQTMPMMAAMRTAPAAPAAAAGTTDDELEASDPEPMGEQITAEPRVNASPSDDHARRTSFPTRTSCITCQEQKNE